MTMVMTVNLQLELSMKMKTIAACVRDLTATLTLRQIWSETVVVSAESLLIMSPAFDCIHQFLIEGNLELMRILELSSLFRTCSISIIEAKLLAQK